MRIYAILDVVAKDYLGGLQVHHHDAVAIRTFGDIASTQGSIVSLHPRDFNLHFLGTLDETGITPVADGPVVVITGKQWLASQQDNPDESHNG